MGSALFKLSRAAGRLVGLAGSLPAPAERAVEAGRKLRDKLDKPRARRLMEIMADAAEQVADELEESR